MGSEVDIEADDVTPVLNSIQQPADGSLGAGVQPESYPVMPLPPYMTYPSTPVYSAHPFPGIAFPYAAAASAAFLGLARQQQQQQQQQQQHKSALMTEEDSQRIFSRLGAGLGAHPSHPAMPFLTLDCHQRDKTSSIGGSNNLNNNNSSTVTNNNTLNSFHPAAGFLSAGSPDPESGGIKKDRVFRFSPNLRSI